MRRAAALFLLALSVGIAGFTGFALAFGSTSGWSRLVHLVFFIASLGLFLVALLFIGDRSPRRRQTRQQGPVEIALARLVAAAFGAGALYVFVVDVVAGFSSGKRGAITLADSPMLYFLQLMTMSGLGTALLWFALAPGVQRQLQGADDGTRTGRADRYAQMLRIHRSVAWLYAVLAVALAFSVFSAGRGFQAQRFVVPVILAALSVAHMLVSTCCRGRDPRCRWLTILTAIPMLAGFPVGTVVGIHLIYESRRPWEGSA